jgi:hypothetical protein
MANRSNVEVLFDSVYTINQVLGNNENNNNSQRGILKANVDHIKLCLGKDEYKTELTAEQTAELNKAVADAEAKIATLPVPEGEPGVRVHRTKVTRLSA